MADHNAAAAGNPQGDNQINPSEYPPPLPPNPPPHLRFLDFYRVNRDELNNPIIPPVIIFSATDNPWNRPFMHGLLDFDYLPESHALLPRLRRPPPCPQVILPPNLFMQPQPHRPVYLLGEYPPLPPFRMVLNMPPPQHLSPPSTCHMPQTLPPLQHSVPLQPPHVEEIDTEPPLPPLDRHIDDAFSSTGSN